MSYSKKSYGIIPNFPTWQEGGIRVRAVLFLQEGTGLRQRELDKQREGLIMAVQRGVVVVLVGENAPTFSIDCLIWGIMPNVDFNTSRRAGTIPMHRRIDDPCSAAVAVAVKLLRIEGTKGEDCYRYRMI